MEEKLLHVDLSEYREFLKFKDGTWIWDMCRKKWLVITPEEIVRQCLCIYLHKNQGIPYSFMATEKALQYGSMLKRADIVVYDQQAQPVILAECKAPDIELSESTIFQLLSYSHKIPTEYYIISNGRQTHFFKKQKSSLENINRLPKFDQIC